MGAAADLADAGGLASVTLKNLAQRLNVRPPSLYNHFDSADALHHHLALFGLQSLCERVARAAIGRNGADGVVAVADTYRAYAKQRPGLYSAALRAAQPDDPGDAADLCRVP